MTPVLKGLRSAFAFVIPVATLLLAPVAVLSGSVWAWTQGVIFVVLLTAMTVASQLALAVFRPESFSVRQQGFVADKARRQPLIDAVGLVAYVLFLVAWVVFIPVDVFALQLLPPPPEWVAALGLVTAVCGYGLAQLAIWQNPFASPTIQDQAGQRVVDSGIYGLIRHPLYAGNLMFFAGSALWLGSVAACIATVAQLAATLFRIGIEEAHLRARLPAYADYARRVRGRLIPFVL